MGYVPLNNYNYDSGYRRIQSGPNSQGFIVLTSGSSAYGVNEGIVVPGSPLSGSPAGGTWDYDSNWRYIPSTLPSQSGSSDPTPYNASGILDTYNAARIYTRDNVAGAQAASAIGPETGKINPRGGALQPRANVTRPEKYMYYGGGAPDNQDYSPYNTPDANTAAEGKTGGGVTHRNYESSLLTNLLGSQGTSDRSQWRYHQPVYCKTFTETQRSATPGLMSSPLRYIYRGSATSYNYNYGSELLANKGGFELLPYDDQTFGCPFPVGCPSVTGSPLFLSPGDVLIATPPCNYALIEWYNTFSNTVIGTGTSYTILESDIGSRIYYTVTYFDNSKDSSSISCLDVVYFSINTNWFLLEYPDTLANQSALPATSKVIFDINGDMYFVVRYSGCLSANIHKVTNNVSRVWSFEYRPDSSQNGLVDNDGILKTFIVSENDTTLELFYTRITSGGPYPLAIYRFRVNKQTGALIDTRTIQYTPLSATGIGTEVANVVKINSDYYILQEYFLFGNTQTCILKFDEDLNLIWSKYLKTSRILSGNCVSPFVSIARDFRESNGNLIGCAYWAVTPNSFVPVAFSLDIDGNALNMLPAIRRTTDLTPLLYGARSLDRDTDGNYYTIGGLDLNSTVGEIYPNIYVIKQSSSGEILWAIDIRPSIVTLSNSGVTVLSSSHLSLVYDKVVIAIPIRVAFFPTRYVPVVAIINSSTGTIDRCFLIRVNAPGPEETGAGVTLTGMPQITGFTVTTPIGYVLRFNLLDLPAAGTYSMTDQSGFYTIEDCTLVQTSVISQLETTAGCTPFTLENAGLSSFFSVNTTISGVQSNPGASISFERFALT